MREAHLLHQNSIAAPVVWKHCPLVVTVHYALLGGSESCADPYRKLCPTNSEDNIKVPLSKKPVLPEVRYSVASKVSHEKCIDILFHNKAVQSAGK